MSLIKNNNGITLRLEKSNSLTFDEMDQNFSSFFYSASTVQSGDTNKLRLYYTGSNELDSGFEANRYMEVLLPKTPESSPAESVSVPGCNTQIIFNCNDSFGASADLVFKNKRLGLGLSEPSAPIHVTKTSTGVDTQIRIEPNNSGNTSSTRAYYSIGIGNTTFLKLGKTSAGSGEETKCMHLFTNKPLEIGYSNFDNTTCRKIRVTSQGVAIGECISSNAVSPLSIQSTTTGAALTIGSNFNSDNRNSIGSLNVHANKLPGSNTQGLLIQSPVGPSGGNVVIGVNSNGSNNESFSVIRGCQNDFASNSSANCSIATFKADGNVGIGQVNPKAKLHIEGNISGSGDIKVHGSATIQTIATKANFCSTSTLVATSAGIVEKIAAAPVPLGGIIMWSGTKENIPKGWRLCDAETEVNGVRVPNLVNRFVIGGIDDATIGGEKRVYTSVETGKKCYVGGNKNAVLIGHSHSATTSITPSSHSHCLPMDCSNCFTDSNRQVGNVQSLRHSDNSDEGLNARCQTGAVTLGATTTICKCGINTSNQSASGQSGTNMNLPPYYALAFIIYVGQ